MARYGISIVKRVSFRNALQEFANVYHYNGPAVDDTALDLLLQQIRDFETVFFSTDVTFVRGLLWTTGGGPATNEMRVQKAFGGTGNQATLASMDVERAVLVQWPAGKNIRGRPVYLRKWFHSCGVCSSVSFGAGVLKQTTAISDPDRNLIALTAANFVTVNMPSGQYQLCANSGRQTSGPGVTYKWLEHHQLGDMWR